MVSTTPHAREVKQNSAALPVSASPLEIAERFELGDHMVRRLARHADMAGELSGSDAVGQGIGKDAQVRLLKVVESCVSDRGVDPRADALHAHAHQRADERRTFVGSGRGAGGRGG